MPSSLPTETLTYSSSSSRPASPAQEAMESQSPIDESILAPDELAKIKSAQNRRKSSSWKGFNLKRQLSKVDMKIKKTFGDTPPVTSQTDKPSNSASNSVFYTMGNIEKTPLSPVEVSPDTESNSTPTDTEQDKSDYIEELERDIVQSLADLEMKDQLSPNNIEQAVELSNSDVDSEPTSLSPSQSTSPQNVAPKFPEKQKKVEFTDAALTKIVSQNVEGSSISRPSDLPLQENYNSERPNVPPRTKKKDKRDQRLLSVPNIKPYTKPDVKDLRKKSTKKEQSSIAGNLMRRFSKYQLNDESRKEKPKKKIYL